MRYSTVKGAYDSSLRKNKGKCKEGEDDLEAEKSKENCLATLDIFAGCGGLSEGLQQSGILSPPLPMCVFVRVIKYTLTATEQVVRYNLFHELNLGPTIS